QNIQFYSPQDRETIKHAFTSAVEEGKSYDLQLKFTNAHGEQLWVRTIGQAKIDDGRVVHVYGNIMDITSQKQAEEKLKLSEEKYRLMFENMFNGFAYHKIVTDNDGKPIDYIFLEMNDSFERMTGLKRKDVIDKHVTVALPGIENDPSDWIGRYGKVAIQGNNIQFESFSEPLNRWYSIYAYCPQQDYFATIFEDITERKQADDEIRKLNAELEQRVLERTAELKEKNKKLQVMLDGFVGRELRMVELKKQITKLKSTIMELNGETSQ
ncbi:MAG: PAS domain S-box protein, partial [Methanosarcinales archaeon]|nr:PAS domain S-box protein [Methanosarcinales archaeon]